MFDCTGNYPRPSTQLQTANAKSTVLKHNALFGHAGVVMSCKGSLVKQNVCVKLIKIAHRHLPFFQVSFCWKMLDVVHSEELFGISENA